MSENTLPTPPKKHRLLVILLVLAALAAGGGASYYWWSIQQKANDSSESPKAPPAAPIFMPLETFTVNLMNPNNSPDRVLYIGLTLRLPDEETRRQMTEFLPEVRSRLIRLLARQDAEQLASEQGKQQLVAQIKDVLHPPLIKEQPEQVVSDVLFTAFILR